MLMTAEQTAAMMPHAESLAATNEKPLPAAPDREPRRIGEMLAVLVQDGNVRTAEAVALVMVRSDWGRICAAAAAPPKDKSGLSSKAIGAGERIARRALAGVLDDPVRGATRFHRIGDLPDWARENRPVAQIGDFLFYEI